MWSSITADHDSIADDAYRRSLQIKLGDSISTPSSPRALSSHPSQQQLPETSDVDEAFKEGEEQEIQISGGGVFKGSAPNQHSNHFSFHQDEAMEHSFSIEAPQ
jgi:hypothetical protein